MPREVKYSACALNCPDICAYQVVIEDGRVTRILGDPNHPYTLGRCCPKGYAHAMRTYYGDRLKHPLRRQPDGSFIRISWDEALDDIAQRIDEARREFGPQSVGIYSGSGNDGMAPRYAARFANALGTRMIPGISEICFKGAYEGARFNVGPFPPHELKDWANSRCLVIWGTNKFESSLHCKRVIQEALDRGAKLIVIDPRRTPHAKMAHIYTTIRPGTDGALALGIANVIIERGLWNRDFVEKYVVGFEEYCQRVREYDVQRVSSLTWVSPSIIRDIAVTFATHGPGLIMTAPAGMNHYTNGTWAARAVHSLLAICGYLGVSGGGFQYLSSDCSPFNNRGVTLDHLLDESVRPVVPSATYLPRLIMNSTTCPLRVLVIQAASPLTQWPNTGLTVEALKRIPFKVCIDLEMTDTARMCDIVLPATFIFEHHNLVYSELHRIVQYAPKLIEPVGECRSELDIWRGIAERLGLGHYFQADELDLIREALRSEECAHISLESLIEHPEGIRTKSEVIPFANRVFNTPSGKVELYSRTLLEMGYDPLPFHEEPAESPVSTPDLYRDYPLIMISGRLRDRLHSQYTTVSTGGSVKSFAQCTTCQRCVEKCPDKAISLVPPSAAQIVAAAEEGMTNARAKLRVRLTEHVRGLSVRSDSRPLAVPLEITSLLVPSWDPSLCIGCRECELDYCPFGVIVQPIRMPCRDEVRG
ncbi:MAG: molybdopterin-dependent oxidoreductase, partial [Candidatus Thorarchaeota archaeon]